VHVTKENLERDCGKRLLGTWKSWIEGLNREDVMDRIRWKKQIWDDW